MGSPRGLRRLRIALREGLPGSPCRAWAPRRSTTRRTWRTWPRRSTRSSRWEGAHGGIPRVSRAYPSVLGSRFLSGMGSGGRHGPRPCRTPTPAIAPPERLPQAGAAHAAAQRPAAAHPSRRLAHRAAAPPSNMLSPPALSTLPPCHPAGRRARGAGPGRGQGRGCGQRRAPGGTGCWGQAWPLKHPAGRAAGSTQRPMRQGEAAESGAATALRSELIHELHVHSGVWLTALLSELEYTPLCLSSIAVRVFVKCQVADKGAGKGSR